MTYDTYGNIISKNGQTYFYDPVWKDLLTGIEGDSIEYDAQGNPTKYLGHELVWEKGRQLKSFDGNTYIYNANGIRTSKTINGVKHEYTLDGTKILRETWDGHTLIPLYDNEDSVCGIIYNDFAYYFLKNLQGDVIAITNNKGNVVASYTYDAWGVCTIVSDNTGIIARVNPFRYRSYYFDSEIGLYYLQSRYYNPQLGRFINADDTKFICHILNTTHNVFSFAKNDPITDSEYLGYISLSAVLMITCALVGAIAKLEDACSLINKSWFKKKYSVSTGLLVCLVAFIWGGVDGLLKGSKITGKWWIVCGTIGAVVAVAEYVAVSGRNAKRYSANDLLWIALKGFCDSIDIPKKGAVKEIVKRILTKIGKKSLLWIINLIA